MAVKVGQDRGAQQRVSLVRRSTDRLPCPGEPLLAPVVLSDCRNVRSVLGQLGQHHQQEGGQQSVNGARYMDLALPDVLKELEYRLSLEGVIARSEVVESDPGGPNINLVAGEGFPAISDFWRLEGRGPCNSRFHLSSVVVFEVYLD